MLLDRFQKHFFLAAMRILKILRPLDDCFIQRIATGDRKSIRSAAYAFHIAIGRLHRLHVKCDTGKQDIRTAVGKRLHLGKVRRSDHTRLLLQQRLQDRDGQTFALVWIGPAAQLIQHDERIFIRLLTDGRKPGQVAGKRRKRFLDGLLIADIQIDRAEERHLRSLAEDRKTGVGHRDEQSDRLERHRLSAGVGTGNDEKVEGFSQTDVNRDYLMLFDQWMPGFL